MTSVGIRAAIKSRAITYKEMGVQVLRNIIFRTLSERRAQLAHARILLERSRTQLQESLANTFVGVKHPKLGTPY